VRKSMYVHAAPGVKKGSQVLGYILLSEGGGSKAGLFQKVAISQQVLVQSGGEPILDALVWFNCPILLHKREFKDYKKRAQCTP